jgi:glycosyltransferase involved in cell wall biosynthesis
MMNKGQDTRILFTCGREPTYVRNAVIRNALARRYNVISVTTGLRWLPLRYLMLTLKLIAFRKPVDGMLVGFYGQPLMLLARKLTRQPILFDAYLSTYDTLCFDRKLFKPGSLISKLAFWIDCTSCAFADQIILDTKAHADYFHETFKVPSEKIHRLFVGCNENIFHTQQDAPPIIEGRVLAFGSYMPLHGMDVIVRAANLLQDDPRIHFHLIGRGMELKRVQHLAVEMHLPNVTFFPPVSQEQLSIEISKAAVCLGGHFGSTGKAARVIAGKTFIGMAMGKAVIVGDNPANRELLTPDHDALFCKMADPAALAGAIRTLTGNPGLGQTIGKNARQTFIARASLPVLSEQLSQIIEGMLSKA